MQSHALVHSLAQTWTQIGRNPAAALGNIAPNIGSVVAIEKDSERKPGQVFPTFLALNSDGAIGQGYFPAIYAPFKVDPTNSGISYTTNPEGQTNFNNAGTWCIRSMARCAPTRPTASRWTITRTSINPRSR